MASLLHALGTAAGDAGAGVGDAAGMTVLRVLPLSARDGQDGQEGQEGQEGREPAPEAERAPDPGAVTEPETLARADVADRPGYSASAGSAGAAARPAAYIHARDLDERPLLLKDIDAVLDTRRDSASDSASESASESASGSTRDALSDAKLPGEPGAAVRSAVGTLLINEYGEVDRLTIETAGLPAELEAILVARFREARFLPGKIAGRPVRSALRIALQVQ